MRSIFSRVKAVFMTTAVALACMPAGRGAQVQAAAEPEPEYELTQLKCSVVQEVKGSTGFSEVTRTAEKGSIVQIVALVRPLNPQAPASIEATGIELSGGSADTAATISWTFNLMGIGFVQNEDDCSYTFPEIIVKGAVSLTNKVGESYKVTRDTEGGPFSVTIANQSRICLAFPAPGHPAGVVKLRLGAAAGSCSLP